MAMRSPMQQRKPGQGLACISALAIMLLAACVPVDSGLLVKGRILAPDGQPYDDYCEGDLYSVEQTLSGERKDFLRKVYWTGRIYDSLDIAPGYGRFVVELKCPGYDTPVTVPFDNGDIGDIVLQ